MTQWIAFQTLVLREWDRLRRIWIQTLIPPSVRTALYFIIFGKLLGFLDGHPSVPYVMFVTPGILMIGLVTAAYSHTSSGYYSLKWTRQVEEMLVASISESVIILGFVTGAVLRCLMVTVIVLLTAWCFHATRIDHLFMSLCIIVLTASLFALAGFINGMFAKTFDDVSLVPNFVLTPLTYLGGVFYSIEKLTPFWNHVSLMNPVFYIVNGLRDAFMGISDHDVHAGAVIVLLCVLNAVMFIACHQLLKRGAGGVRH